MNSTGMKINKILNDIGYLNQNMQSFEDENLSTDEVVKILLKKDVQKNENIITGDVVGSHDNRYYIDMKELNKWRDNNNYINQVSGEIVITSHRKNIGKIIVYSKKIVRKMLRWFIAPLIEQQNRVNGSFTASINALTNNDLVINKFIEDFQEGKINIIEIEELKNQSEELTRVRAEIEELKNQSEELTRVRAEIEELKNQSEELTRVRAEIEELKNQSNISILADELSRQYESNIARINQELDILNFRQHRDRKNIKSCCKDSEINVKEGLINQYSKHINIENEFTSNFDYHLFENKFRGSREEIKERQTNYLKYFFDSSNVLDIGCGRGEFIELLSENGIKSKGIDVYEDFVEYCRYKGLNVLKDDALNYLLIQDDESIDGIFMSQVAEHLETDYLINLVEAAYEKLKKGKFFIAETPNPKTLSIFSNAFFMDPSHKKPVHPETFKFIFEKAGFKDVKIEFTEVSKIDYKLPLLTSNYVDNLEEFNDGINLLSEMFFGSQDYAIIARK